MTRREAKVIGTSVTLRRQRGANRQATIEAVGADGRIKVGGMWFMVFGSSGRLWRRVTRSETFYAEVA